jgi:hypothetical protein
MAPADPAVVAQVVAASPLSARYGQPVDRDSAYERLAARLAAPPAAPEEAPERRAPRRRTSGRPAPERPAADDDGVLGQVLGSPVFRSFARSAASALGREITRGLFGTRRRRR